MTEIMMQEWTATPVTVENYNGFDIHDKNTGQWIASIHTKNKKQIADARKKADAIEKVPNMMRLLDQAATALERTANDSLLGRNVSQSIREFLSNLE